MVARVLRWQSHRTRQACLAEVARRLAEWAAGWGVASVGASLQDASEARLETLTWRSFETARGAAWLGLPADAVECLGSLVAGVAVQDTAGLAEHLGQKALSALCGSVFGEERSVWQSCDVPAPAELLPRHGGLLVRLELGGEQGLLLLDARAVDAMAPRAPLKRGGLVSWRNAIGPEPVHLTALLHAGKSALSEWKEVRPGDLITLGPLAATRVELASNHQTLGRGQLVAQEGRRAVRLGIGTNDSGAMK